MCVKWIILRIKKSRLLLVKYFIAQFIKQTYNGNLCQFPGLYKYCVTYFYCCGTHKAQISIISPQAKSTIRSITVSGLTIWCFFSLWDSYMYQTACNYKVRVSNWYHVGGSNNMVLKWTLCLYIKNQAFREQKCLNCDTSESDRVEDNNLVIC